jgi:hypothetical protein
LIDLEQMEGAFSFKEGFSRPDWERIGQRIEALSREDRPEAWRQAARQWIWRLRADLGGSYGVFESPNFLLLAEFPDEAKRLLRFCESAQDFLSDGLGEAAWRGAFGKQVVLLFTDTDDYYQYIAFFYPDGTHAQSSGLCIHTGGYVHLAVPRDERSLKRVLAHELTHDNLAHLPIPAWLNEGLAQNFEDDLVPMGYQHLTPEAIDSLRAFWNDDNLHEFWSGEGFHDPAAQEPSYLLARFLVLKMATNRKQFIDFIQHAHYRDAGDEAAENCLGVDLGEAVAPFVSAENPRPRADVIARYLGQPERVEDEKGERP